MAERNFMDFKTVRLYDTNPYCVQFNGKIISCVALGSVLKTTDGRELSKEGHFRVVLDQSAFFPGGGGQACDKGMIGGHKVIYVYEEAGHMYHIVEGQLTPGATVQCAIDWEYRFGNMQNHSGEHILSGIVYAEKGYNNVGFHLADTYMTVDFDGPLSEDELNRLELLANRRVYDNLPITVFYPSAQELEQMHYRSKKELSGAIRIVQVGDVDLCACCAPHVAHTGEIGIIKIIKHEKYKGGVRLTILCGERALLYMQNEVALMHRLGSFFSATSDTLEEKAKRFIDQSNEQKQRTDLLSAQLIEARTALWKNADHPVFFIEETLDEIASRRMAQAISQKTHQNVCVLLPKGLPIEQEYRYIICSSGSNLLSFAPEFNKAFSGRGGGGMDLIQGTVHGDANRMKDVFLQLK